MLIRFIWKEVLEGGRQIERLVQAGKGEPSHDSKRAEKVAEVRIHFYQVLNG